MFIALLLNALLLTTTPPTTEAPVASASLKRLLPKWRTHGLYNKDSTAQLNAYRTAHPELYGVTVPPGSEYKLYAEFGTMDRIYLVYTDDFRQYWLDIIAEAAAEIEVYILLAEENEQAPVQAILEANLDPAVLANVYYFDSYPYEHYVYQNPYYDAGIDAIWTVDFGPFYLLNDSGEYVISDARYYPERLNDDAVPTKLGDAFGVPVYRNDIYIEGGNLLSDGLGNCYGTTVIQDYNNRYSVAELEQAMEQNLGCHNMVWLEPQQNEGTGHIDMFFILADAHTAIVGEYTTSQDAANKAILDQNAQLMENTLAGDGQPITVYRIPMPDPGSDYYGRIWRTYTNGLRVNGRYLMPVYNNETTYQNDAVSVIEMALPGVTVVPIGSDGIIEWGGAIHCTTRTRPAGTPVVLTEDPAYRCDGAYECDECVDDCVEGETGCNADGSRYFCGQGDSDSCLDKITMACPESASCDEATGMCAGFTCEDECAPAEYGCDDNGTSYYCAEAGDGDPCLDKVLFPCEGTDECFDGICMPANGECGDITYEGECQGNFSVYCYEGEVIVDDCGGQGLVCAFVNNEGYYDCNTAPTCEDECAPGESMCGTNEGEILHCAELFDGDSCLEWRSESCPVDNSCVDGICQPDACEDECTEGDATCADQVTSQVCVMDETTGCTVLTETSCNEGDECNDDTGMCVTPGEGGSSDSGCGCSTPGAPTNSNLPLFLLLLIPALFITRRTHL